MKQGPWFVRVGFAVIVAAIVTVLGVAVITLSTEAEGLAPEVEGRLAEAGAKNPVTAVLLNFRGYDTLLEITVLLLAVLGARALATGETQNANPASESEVNPVLLGFIRIVAPVMILMAGYLLWAGGHAPGGAFQAGAVLAALGVLLNFGGVNWSQRLPAWGERGLLVVGLAAFLVVGLGTMLAQHRFLEYAPDWAKWCILLIEAFATISIVAILLALFFSGTLPQTGPHEVGERSEP